MESVLCASPQYLGHLPREVPMDDWEKAYQPQGHAKFADIARLFGWGGSTKPAATSAPVLSTEAGTPELAAMSLSARPGALSSGARAQAASPRQATSTQHRRSNGIVGADLALTNPF